MLVGAWGKGTFPTLAKTIAYHFEKHGADVGAKNTLQYMRKAFEFTKNLRGAEKQLLKGGATRYMKNGRYVDILDGKIVSSELCDGRGWLVTRPISCDQCTG